MSTDFSRYAHEQLIAMLQGQMPTRILAGADDLQWLANRIAEAEHALDGRLRVLEWQGESADQFRRWASEVTAAARHLSEFVRETSTQLRVAGEQLARTKLPPVNRADQAQTSAATETERTAATQRLAAARNEAVRQMQALASTYQVAAERLESLEEPRFPAAANVLGLRVQDLTALNAPGTSLTSTSTDDQNPARSPALNPGPLSTDFPSPTTESDSGADPAHILPQQPSNLSSATSPTETAANQQTQSSAGRDGFTATPFGITGFGPPGSNVSRGFPGRTIPPTSSSPQSPQPRARSRPFTTDTPPATQAAGSYSPKSSFMAPPIGGAATYAAGRNTASSQDSLEPDSSFWENRMPTIPAVIE